MIWKIISQYLCPEIKACMNLSLFESSPKTKYIYLITININSFSKLILQLFLYKNILKSILRISYRAHQSDRHFVITFNERKRETTKQSDKPRCSPLLLVYPVCFSDKSVFFLNYLKLINLLYDEYLII